MATLNEHIYNIRNTPDKGKSSRSKNYSDRQIAFWLNAVRKFLFTKIVEKSVVLPSYETDLGCITLQTVDQADCPAFIWGDDVKKAVIPEIMDIQGNKGLTFFGLIDKRTRIYVPDQQFGSLDDFNQYPPKMIGYMIGKDTIYLKGAAKLCVVNVRGIFDDPTLTSYYDEQGIEYCFDWDKTHYPIPSDMEQTMYDLVFEKYIMKFAGAPMDTKNDERSDLLV